MSLSKNIAHYRRCVINPSIRHFGGSNTVEPPKMTTKAMALTQWKILNILKDYYTKYSGDKNMNFGLNKEIVKLLQKFQPSVYGSDIVRFFETPSIENTSMTHKGVKSSEAKPEPSSVENLINGIKNKMGQKEEVQVPKDIVPKWVSDMPTISKESIMSRTTHLINSITNAENDSTRLGRLEDLSLHIQKFPEAKTCAVKEGAIRLLLRLRSEASQNTELCGAINEVFALLGYTDPLPGRGIRILSIDGGGVRGILVIEMLKKLEELTGKRVYEMFDYICGVSTGAILACSFAVLQKTCDQLKKDYVDISTEVFTQSTLKGTSSLVWSHSYYDTPLWEKRLRQQMGETTLVESARNGKCPKLSTISAVVNHERVTAHIFRNYSLPWRVQSQYMGSSCHKVWEATRASAAAPTYFEECKLGNLLHQDGGILVNNPTAVAIHEAKLLWPNAPIQCVVSFGTGRTVPNPLDSAAEHQGQTSSWKNKFLKILDSATDTEGVHIMLSDLLPQNVYFRFNPYLTEMLSMSEIHPEKLEQLDRDAIMYLRRNEDKFQLAAKALMEPKTYAQKGADFIRLQKELLGFSSKL